MIKTSKLVNFVKKLSPVLENLQTKINYIYPKFYNSKRYLIVEYYNPFGNNKKVFDEENKKEITDLLLWEKILKY